MSSLAARHQLSRSCNVVHLAIFAVGAFLPLVSLQQHKGSSGHLADRVTVADVAVVCILVLFSAVRIPHVPGYARLYFFALPVALLVGICRALPYGEDGISALTAFVALLMASLYLVFGYLVGQRSDLLRWLLVGIVAGVAWEFLIVVHDFFAPGKWFPDPMEGRVRGTFRSSGQLASFGFAAGGILLALGWPLFRTKWQRIAIALSGVAAICMVFAATRRSAIFAIVLWLLAYCILGARQERRLGYVGVLVATCGVVAGIIGYSSALSDTLLWRRLASAVNVISEDESFMHQQAAMAISRSGEWFPIGCGVGRAHVVDEFNEIHNGHLAILVEQGVLGSMGFYLLVGFIAIRFLQHCFQSTGTAHATRVWQTSMSVVSVAFIAAVMLFMMHNRCHRDRGLMLFFGLAGAALTTEFRAYRQVHEEPALGEAT